MNSGGRKERHKVRRLLEFILRLLAAILAVGVCVALGTFVSSLLGGFLFHKGIIDDVTLFSFPLYGVLPGLLVGGVCYAVILVGTPVSK